MNKHAYHTGTHVTLAGTTCTEAKLRLGNIAYPGYYCCGAQPNVKSGTGSVPTCQGTLGTFNDSACNSLFAAAPTAAADPSPSPADPSPVTPVTAPPPPSACPNGAALPG